jgi:signal transduction histidine kinase/ligand-binding sensor domain-containing protein
MWYYTACTSLRVSFYGSVRLCQEGAGVKSERGWRHEPDLRIQRECLPKHSSRILRLLTRLTILFCMIQTAHAQYGFEVWTVDNGLPENEIRGITQTPDGYLWIATFNGLARFDGVHLTLFNRETPGLLSNQFGTMLQGRNGDLWLDSVDRGAVRYHDGVFRAYGRQYGVPADIINGLTGDDHGDVWLLAGDRILRWDEASGHFVDVAPQSPSLRYRSLLWDSAGFWVREHERVRCFAHGTFVDYTLPKQILGDTLWGAALDQSGTLWLETVDGKRARITADNVSHMIPASFTREVTVGTTYNKSLLMHVGARLQRSFEFVNANRVVSVTPWHFYEDRQGNLWIGTLEEGLYRLQPQLIHSYSTEQGLIDRDTYATYQDRAGAVWIGAWHSGLSRFADGKFSSYTMADGLPDELVTALFEDREGRFWVGTHGGLSLFDHGRFRKASGPILPYEAVVQAIWQDRSGTLWFGTRQGLARYANGVTRFLTQKDGLAADDTHAILEAANGDLWVGGYGGLTRIRNGEFTRWTEKDGLPSGNIWSFHEDTDGALWIGTYDGGLARFKDGKLTSYSVKDGLFDEGVFRILEDAHGYFWISCSRGVYRVSKQDLNAFASGDLKKVTSTAYGKIDGMLDIECNGGVEPAGTKTRDGKLWFPTRNGVAVIDPESVVHDSVPPLMMVESSLVDNVTTPVNAPLRIPPGRPNVEISYTAPNFINAAQTHFKYKLDGLDPDWIDAGGRRIAYYSHLPPGEYSFHVIAGNSDGVWNQEGKTLAITALSPFYETRWFQLLVLLTLGALVAMAWKYRVAQLQREQVAQQAFSRQLIASQEAERKRIAAEMHDSLGQRLVIIKNLAYLLSRSKKAAASDESDAQTIAEISEEASSAIAETREISYNLRPFQLDRLGLTKAIEAMIRTTGIASGIRFTSELDNIDDVFPEDLRINFYRIVQESLGNIMKHAQATEVSVRIKRRIENVILTIEDNGRGFAPEERNPQPSTSGFGLTGMGERARLLGGELKVRSIPGKGTTVLFEIPLKK